MGTIISSILPYINIIKYGIIAIVCIIIAIWGYNIYSSYNGLKTEVSTLEKTNSELQVSISQQNVVITKLQENTALNSQITAQFLLTSSNSNDQLNNLKLELNTINSNTSISDINDIFNNTLKCLSASTGGKSC